MILCTWRYSGVYIGHEIITLFFIKAHTYVKILIFYFNLVVWLGAPNIGACDAYSARHYDPIFLT